MEELRALWERGEAAGEKWTHQCSVSNLRKPKEPLKIFSQVFFVFFFLFFLLLLLLWTMETERSCIKGEKGKGDFLEGRRHSPASHLPHCPIDHSRKAGLTRSMGINNRAPTY